MAHERTFSTRNGVQAKARKTSIGLLNQALADMSDLHSQVKQAHWNLKGMEFMALHELFDTMAAEIMAHVDSIAERVTALGGYAMGTARMAAAHSKLPEMDVEITSGPEYVKALADRYGVVANAVRKAVDTTAEGDVITSDLLTGVTHDLDKRLWFLEAHLTE